MTVHSEEVVGWLGTGRMGSMLVRRLLAAGTGVLAYNRTRARAEPFAAEGAKVVDRAAELARAPIVFVMVGTSQDLIDAVLGPDGLLAGEDAPAVVVDCSTVSVDASEHVRKGLAARGSAFLAAAVMGNPRVAAAGRVTFAVSGPPDAAALVQPYLDLLGAGASYVGPGEAARTVKLCHNLLLGAVIQALTEVTVLAEKAGISRQAFLSCINNSVLGSTFTRYKSPALVNLDYHPTFTGELLRKDLDMGLKAAREHEVPMPVAALVHQIVQSLVGHGYGEQDFAALIELQAHASGIALASENAEMSDGLD
ncbi:MAG TPA: NAD(P)-dependent oxidoreductase [Streptosporangiaceae bacterium]|nr:NAD(P)-dependent oxidoreductase [Streptosporangiaceae bacterium]